MFGILNTCKPQGITSRDVVNRVQRMVRPAKVGHAGTLDPLATGVLVVCIGPATRLVEYIQRLPKHYVGTFELGQTSDTEDTEGTVVPLEDAPHPSRAQIEAVLPNFCGRIMQRPPAFSALKIHGHRAYKLARKGDEVQLEPRPVSIDRLELLEYCYPQMQLAVTCGAGTYIRSLGRDIGEALGTGAVMSKLERRAIGPFQIDRSCLPEQITRETLSEHLLPPILAVADVPRLSLTPEQLVEISHGRVITVAVPTGSSTVAGVDSNQRLVALLTPAPGANRLRAFRYFPPQ